MLVYIYGHWVECTPEDYIKLLEKPPREPRLLSANADKNEWISGLGNTSTPLRRG
jgi:hypothetical protein